MIRFTKIRYKNLLSVGNIFTEIDLVNNAVTLIIGDNGVGKSTLLDALSFGLFGKAFRNINKPLLVNSITGKHLVVEIEFIIGEISYKIIRGIKPNIFELYQNDVLLNQTAESKDYQEILEKQILKVNHKSFCQVVILGSATFRPFMQLPAAQRREVVEDILDLQIFTVMNSVLKDKVQKNNDAIIVNQGEQKLINEKVKLIKEHLLEIQNSNESIIKEKQSQIEDLEIKIIVQQSSIEVLTIEIKKFEKRVINEDRLRKKKIKLGNLKFQIEENLGDIKSDIHFFNSHEDCPTCKQKIGHEFRTQTISEKEQQVEKIVEGLKLLEEQYDELNDQISEIDNINLTMADSRMDISIAKTKIESLTNHIKEIKLEIERITKKTEDQDTSKIDELNSQLSTITDEYSELLEEKQILIVAGSLLKDSGIKAKIISQYVPIINRLINKYLASMDFFVQFELDEQFKETIKSRYRDEFSYESFSEGEKQRIDLSLLFTWRALAKLRNSINTNILIMDEVFDKSLDNNGVEQLMDIIKTLASDTNLFVISHKEIMNDKFSHIIKFTKYKNFTQMQKVS